MSHKGIMSTKFEKEEDLEMATVPFINEYFDNWSWQIPVYYRVIDFGGIKDNVLIGIEYKLKDWKRAIWQAHGHRLTFDYLYILLPKRKISQILRTEARKVGIGVLLFSGKGIEIAIKPKRQWMIWNPRRKEVVKWIKEIPLHKRQYSDEELETMRERFSIFNKTSNVT